VLAHPAATALLAMLALAAVLAGAPTHH
jgi:hypothetical protein